jgi:hypothetical protein
MVCSKGEVMFVLKETEKKAFLVQEDVCFQRDREEGFSSSRRL